jgi:glycosyltransferase involved in cell wall biosynthesis
LTRRFWPLVGGAEVVMANLAAEFRRQGHAATIVTAQWEKHWPRDLVHREVPVVRMPQPKLRTWGTLRYMYALGSWLSAQRSQLDGVLVSMLKHDAYAAVGALRGSGVPVVVRAEGGGAAGDCQWQATARFGMRIRRRCYEADAIVAPSDAIGAELLAAGYDPAKIKRIDNGVRLPPPRAPLAREAARSALAEANWDLKCEPDAPVAVYTGRLHPDKGLLDLVQAWPTVAKRWPNARLWLIGEGPQREELFERIGDLGFRYQVCLPGSFDEIDDVLAAADLFVLPSYSEGMSISCWRHGGRTASSRLDIPEPAGAARAGRALGATARRQGAASDRPIFDSPAQVCNGAPDRRVAENSHWKSAREHLELIASLTR